jgi:hypothetical integral membrane protein (TIGR02206 family)
MVYQQTVSIFSTTWWTCISFAFVFIILFLKLPAYASWGRKKNYTKFLGLVILINLIVENIYGLYLGVWDVKHFLPLQFCGITGILASILMFKYSKNIAEIVYYWGIPGGLYALITPQFDLGTSSYFFYGYIISHASIILIPLYAIFYENFMPPKLSWLKIFMITQTAALLVMAINMLLGSNYMYLSSPPIAQNLLIIGKWPWYLLVFECLALGHFFILYSFFHKIKHRISLFQKKADNQYSN